MNLFFVYRGRMRSWVFIAAATCNTYPGRSLLTRWVTAIILFFSKRRIVRLASVKKNCGIGEVTFTGGEVTKFDESD